MEMKLEKIILVFAIMSCCRGDGTSQRQGPVNDTDGTIKEAEIKNGVGVGHLDETQVTPTKSTHTTAANTKTKTATINVTTTTEPTTTTVKPKTTTTEMFTTTTAEITTTGTTIPTTTTLTTTTTKTPCPTPSPPPDPHCSWSWRDFSVGLFSGITLSLAVTVIVYAIYGCMTRRQGFVPLYSYYKYETFTS